MSFSPSAQNADYLGSKIKPTAKTVYLHCLYLYTDLF